MITLEPYLKHYYEQNINRDLESSKCFHIMGIDILIDKKCNAWLMEINSNPSLNIFLEREIPGALEGQTEKVLQELDKHVKSKVVSEAIRIVTGEGNDEYDGSFDQILPYEEEDNEDDYYIWNKGQHLFDIMVNLTGSKKDADLKGRLSLFQFSRFHKVPEFSKVGSYFKADLEIAFKNM